jgi:hypothetical protein
VIATVLVALSSRAVADSPAPLPHSYVACSPTERFCADLDFKKDLIRVYEKRTERTLWTMPGWFPNVWLSEDGEVIAVTRDDLVPEYNPDLPVIDFFRRGRRAGQVRMGEAVPKSETTRTVSHVFWGMPEGFGVDGRFSVKTPHERRVFFTPVR